MASSSRTSCCCTSRGEIAERRQPRERCHRRPWHGGRSSRATRRSCGTRGCGAPCLPRRPPRCSASAGGRPRPTRSRTSCRRCARSAILSRGARAGCASWRTGSRRRSSSSTTASPRAAAASPTTSRSSTRTGCCRRRTPSAATASSSSRTRARSGSTSRATTCCGGTRGSRPSGRRPRSTAAPTGGGAASVLERREKPPGMTSKEWRQQRQEVLEMVSMEYRIEEFIRFARGDVFDDDTGRPKRPAAGELLGASRPARHQIWWWRRLWPKIRDDLRLAADGAPGKTRGESTPGANLQLREKVGAGAPEDLRLLLHGFSAREIAGACSPRARSRSPSTPPPPSARASGSGARGARRHRRGRAARRARAARGRGEGQGGRPRALTLEGGSAAEFDAKFDARLQAAVDNELTERAQKLAVLTLQHLLVELLRPREAFGTPRTRIFAGLGQAVNAQYVNDELLRGGRRRARRGAGGAKRERALEVAGDATSLVGAAGDEPVNSLDDLPASARADIMKRRLKRTADHSAGEALIAGRRGVVEGTPPRGAAVGERREHQGGRIPDDARDWRRRPPPELRERLMGRARSRQRQRRRRRVVVVGRRRGGGGGGGGAGGFGRREPRPIRVRRHRRAGGSRRRRRPARAVDRRCRPVDLSDEEGGEEGARRPRRRGQVRRLMVRRGAPGLCEDGAHRRARHARAAAAPGGRADAGAAARVEQSAGAAALRPVLPPAR